MQSAHRSRIMLHYSPVCKDPALPASLCSQASIDDGSWVPTWARPQMRSPISAATWYCSSAAAWSLALSCRPARHARSLPSPCGKHALTRPGRVCFAILLLGAALHGQGWVLSLLCHSAWTRLTLAFLAMPHLVQTSAAHKLLNLTLAAVRAREQGQPASRPTKPGSCGTTLQACPGTASALVAASGSLLGWDCAVSEASGDSMITTLMLGSDVGSTFSCTCKCTSVRGPGSCCLCSSEGPDAAHAQRPS